MKNIITAIGSPEINSELVRLNKYNVLAPDIQYQEGIIEILQEKDNINILILSDMLEGDIKLTDFVFDIKKANSNLDMIIILENENEELKNQLIAKGFFNIFYNNVITFNEVINLIDNNKKNIEKEITEEINNLKKIILENNNKKIKNNLLKNIFYLINNKLNKIKTSNKNKKTKIHNKNKIICVTGVRGAGKTTTTILLAKYLSKKENKILIIDFDILENNINLILGRKKYLKKIKEINLNNLIIKINKKINLISEINILFNSKIEINKIKTMLTNLKELNKYNYIIIDTSHNSKEEYTKYLIKNSDYCLHILEGNLLSLKKSREALCEQVNNWYIPKEKINIIFNKYNKYAISEKILNSIFSEFKVLGKIRYSDKYNLIINKNKLNIKSKQIKNDYKTIINNLKSEKSKRKIKLDRRNFYGHGVVRAGF